MRNIFFNLFGLKQVCCYALSLVCFTLSGCSDGLIRNEVELDNASVDKVTTRTEVPEVITIGGRQYDVLDYFGFITTIGCIHATATSHLDIKINYPTVSSLGSITYKECEQYYNYHFSQTKIYDWCNPIESIVEDQLDIFDNICVPSDGSDIELYLDITANDGPYTWGGKEECIWIRYYLTHKDYTYKYLKLVNSKTDPQHYKARLAVPFNIDDVSGYIYLGDVRISDSYGNWGPKYLSY